MYTDEARGWAKDAVGKIGERFEAGGEGYVLKLAGTDELQWKARGGDELRFETAAGADVQKLGVVVVAKFAADRKGGNDMAAGAASSDGDAEGAGLLRGHG